MFVLDSMLKLAAEGDWQRVVQRCAWCSRVADQHGNYVIAHALSDETIYSDGICPACAGNALAELARRSARRAVLAAAAA